MMPNFDGSYCDCDLRKVSGSASVLEENAIVSPSGFTCWAKKFNGVTPPPPGMFCGTIAGFPGKYFPRKRPNSRAEISVPPPAVVGMIILIDLPSKETASAAPTGPARQISAATASKAVRDRLVIFSLHVCGTNIQNESLLLNVQALFAENGRH